MPGLRHYPVRRGGTTWPKELHFGESTGSGVYPEKVSRTPLPCSALCPARFLERGVQSVADASEGSADVAGEGVHPGSCRQGDQGYDERVLNQILTFLFRQAALQILHTDIQVQHDVLHALSSWVMGLRWGHRA